jgi:hypothetical protein
MVNLGFWQLGRLDERKASNAIIVEAEKPAAVPIAELLPEGVDTSAAAVDEASYRSVIVTGVYRVDQQVLIPNRTYNGAAGFWVITPIEQVDGTAVVINVSASRSTRNSGRSTSTFNSNSPSRSDSYRFLCRGRSFPKVPILATRVSGLSSARSRSSCIRCFCAEWRAAVSVKMWMKTTTPITPRRMTGLAP